MKETWVSKGDVRQICSNNKQTLGKEKASKRKTKDTPQRIFSKKEVDGKKWIFEREDKSQKNKIGRKETVEDRPFVATK